METKNYLMSNYAQLPVTFESGKGVYLYDENGKQYLDAISGIAVCGLGHCHPQITKAICNQAKKLVHTSNLYNIKNQLALAEALIKVSDGMEKVFFANSGAEANECAIKIARYYGNQKNIKTPSIIVMENAFHGRTLATLTASTGEKVQKGFEPLVEGFVRVPFNNIDAVKSALSANSDIVAIMLEPMQGEGGINIGAPEYIMELRKICDEKSLLLIFDEVQTGNARTGKYFAYQHYNVLPDVVTTAKGLGNGLPIGACLAKGMAAQIFYPGKHATTSGGGPLVTAAALEVINVINQKKLADKAKLLGVRILKDLRKELKDCSHVVDIRGKGLLIGIELSVNCTSLVSKALEKGILINVTREKVVRLLPALVTKNQEADLIVKKVAELIRENI